MDKSFHDLLERYIKGDCTREEIEEVNRWYEEIADGELLLDETEETAIKARTLVNIQKGLHGKEGNQRFLFAYPAVKVAAAALLVTVCGLWLFTQKGPMSDNGLTKIPKVSGEIIFENQTGERKPYTLPDGSVVQLEPSGRLQFSAKFLSDKREARLTGRAFFDIVKDPERPFYVYTGRVTTMVLGTSFFIDARENIGKVEVEVISGKVSVFHADADTSSKDKKHPGRNIHSTNNGVVLSPNQKVEYFIDEDHWVTGLVEEPVPVKPIAKERLSFVFDNTPLRSVLEDIHSRYGIEVVTENEKISKCTFTGDVSRMALYDMLDVISNSIGSAYEVKGTRILVSGKGCD